MNGTAVSLIKATMTRSGPSETTERIADQYFAELVRQLHQPKQVPPKVLDDPTPITRSSRPISY